MLAGLGSGWFASLEEAAAAMRGKIHRFEPAMDAPTRDVRLGRWRDALAKV
jgi:glycerol kinase